MAAAQRLPLLLRSSSALVAPSRLLRAYAGAPARRRGGPLLASPTPDGAPEASVLTRSADQQEDDSIPQPQLFDVPAVPAARLMLEASIAAPDAAAAPAIVARTPLGTGVLPGGLDLHHPLTFATGR